jgi:hypothetical protein
LRKSSDIVTMTALSASCSHGLPIHRQRRFKVRPPGPGWDIVARQDLVGPVQNAVILVRALPWVTDEERYHPRIRLWRQA